MSEHRFLNFTIAFALTLMIGRSLAIGRNLLLPVIVAVIVVYIVSSASEALRKLPLAQWPAAGSVDIQLS
jgi:AI-2 transport protein TqsA